MAKINKSKYGELGSMMIEALAMLGLISMVTPVVYKKAAERNAEIQDVNAAAQVRSLVKAVDDYITDNYSKMTEGQTVSNSCAVGSENYSAFSGTGEASVNIDISHLCDYLPYGFLDENGNVKDTKMFSKDYQVAIKKMDTNDGKKVLTGFLLAQPNLGKDFSRVRSSRISSMIGGNGGFVENDTAYGVQGMWEVQNISSNLGFGQVEDGAIVTTSAQPISVDKANTDELLHRVYKDKRELNTMETSLLMGKTAAEGQNIENVNRIVITAENANAGNGTEYPLEANWNEKALWVKGTGNGAYIDGVLQAADGKFSVDSDSNVVTDGTLSAATGNFTVGQQGEVSAAAGNFTVSQDGNTYMKGSLAAANNNFTVDTTGNTKIKAELEVEKKLYVGEKKAPMDTKRQYDLQVFGNAFITGVLKVGDFKAKTIDTEVLRAGTNDVENDADNQYTTYTDQNNFIVGKTTNKNAADLGVFHVERAGYTYAKGLRAGLADGTLYPFEVENTAAGNINMRLRTPSSTISAKNTSGDNLLYISENESLIQNVRGANYSRGSFTDGVAQMQVSNTGGQSRVLVEQGKIALDVENGTSDGNLVVYERGSSTTGVNRPQVWVRNGTDFKVLDQSKDVIFNVDQSADMKDTAYMKTTDGQSRGSVYVRKGVIELASNQGHNMKNPQFVDGKEDIGYIKGDMLVSQKPVDTGAFYYDYFTEGNGGKGTTPYDVYMVNPAYTSVMHDIKLTTRGGARLSDILPDFINRGIYIVDNTYKEGSIKNAQIFSCSGGKCEGVTTPPSSTQIAGANDYASPWLGVVPAPQCPPGYMKAITLAPLSFDMAQAGNMWGQDRELFTQTDPYEVIYGTDNPYNVNASISNIYPLTFQKNTHLTTRVYRHGTTANFKGWSTLMGFIYPIETFNKNLQGGDSKYYQKYVNQLVENKENGYVWNLFPVYGNDLEALATVYCYFDRGDYFADRGGSPFNSELVDTQYDQLRDLNSGTTPGSNLSVTNKNNAAYKKRLNDPNLKYDDPW